METLTDKYIQEHSVMMCDMRGSNGFPFSHPYLQQEDAIELVKKTKEGCIEAHRKLCPELPVTKDTCYADALNIHKCNDECPYMKDFKEQLNKI